MIKTFCDRCGKEVKQDQTEFEIKTLINEDTTTKEIVLCVACLTVFSDWRKRISLATFDVLDEFLRSFKRKRNGTD